MPTYEYNLQIPEMTTAEHVAELLYDLYDGGIGTELARRKTGDRGGGMNYSTGEYFCFDGGWKTTAPMAILFKVKAKGERGELPREWGAIPTKYFRITSFQVDPKELEKAVQQVRTALGGG